MLDQLFVYDESLVMKYTQSTICYCHHTGQSHVLLEGRCTVFDCMCTNFKPWHSQEKWG